MGVVLFDRFACCAEILFENSSKTNIASVKQFFITILIYSE